MRQGAASTGKLGEVMRSVTCSAREPIFLFTQQAPAHGRESDDAGGICKHGFGKELTTAGNDHVADDGYPFTFAMSVATRAVNMSAGAAFEHD